MGFSWCLRTIEKNGCLCTSLSMLIKKLYGFSFVFGFLNKYKAEWPKRTLAAFLSVLPLVSHLKLTALHPTNRIT